MATCYDKTNLSKRGGTSNVIINGTQSIVSGAGATCLSSADSLKNSALLLSLLLNRDYVFISVLCWPWPEARSQAKPKSWPELALALA